MLALSGEPGPLLNMALDSLVRVLGTECCWVQTIDGAGRSLQLAAERGFNSEMRREVSELDMARGFGRQVVGLASSIVIPDLSRDGRYGLRSFGTAGYRWLVAVPLMTYREEIPPKKEQKPPEGGFPGHAHKMSAFRRLHH